MRKYLALSLRSMILAISELMTTREVQFQSRFKQVLNNGDTFEGIVITYVIIYSIIIY